MRKITLLCLLIIINTDCFGETYGVIGDAGYWNLHSKKVRDSILNSNVEELILPGDNLYDTSLNYSDVWDNWYSEGLKTSVVALGNHYRSIGEEIDYFDMPGRFFSITKGNVRFIVLDSETMLDIDRQALFLESELNSSKQTFNIVIFHHPPATISYRHGWKERMKFHVAMKPILFENSDRVDLIINGHDHLASLFTYGEIPVLVSGAVFESRPAPAFNYTREDGVAVKTLWTNNEGFFWIRLDFDALKRRIWLNFVRADQDKVSCSIMVSKSSILRRRNCFENGSRAEGQLVEFL